MCECRPLAGCRSYLYLKQQDEEKVKETQEADEATREEGVPLQWAIATEISNSTTFLVPPPLPTVRKQ